MKNPPSDESDSYQFSTRAQRCGTSAGITTFSKDPLSSMSDNTIFFRETRSNIALSELAGDSGSRPSK